MMNPFALYAVVLMILVALTFYRVIAGPTAFDRFLAASMSGTTAAFAVGMVGFWFGRPDMFIDLILAYALLNFVGLIVAAKVLESRTPWRGSRTGLF